MEVLLVGKESNFSTFRSALAEHEIAVTSCTTSAGVRSLLQTNSYAAVVVDAVLEDGDGLAFLQQFAKEYPLINCAFVSDLDPGEFHEVTEGLGLFMQLPPVPGKKEAKQMVEILEKINNLMRS